MLQRPPSSTPSEPAALHGAGEEQLPHRQVLVVLSGLLLGMALAMLEQTIVATALPAIARDLGGIEQLAWIATGYLLAATVSTPLWGKLGDLLGRKSLYQVAIGIFVAGSLLCGFAGSMGALILSRGAQGLGAGGVLVLTQAMLADVIPARQRGRYLGYFHAVYATASVLGPLLGGFFTDHLSWRWVFFVNVPLGLVALVVTRLVLPASVRRPHVRVDYLGAALLTGGVSALVLVAALGGVTWPWGSAQVLGLGIVGVALLALCWVVERRSPEPVVPPRLFRDRTFNVASVGSFTTGIALFGAVSFLPLFLQVVHHASATTSGLLLLPMVIGLLVASSTTGRLTVRTGRYRRFPVIGLGLATLAMLLLGTMGPSTAQPVVVASMVLLGVGLGMTMQTLVLATQNAAPPGDLGAATSLVTFFRSMGAALGLALLGAVFASSLAHGVAVAVPRAFLVAVPFLLGGWLVVLLLRELPLSTRLVTPPSAEAVPAALPPRPQSW